MKSSLLVMGLLILSQQASADVICTEIKDRLLGDSAPKSMVVRDGEREFFLADQLGKIRIDADGNQIALAVLNEKNETEVVVSAENSLYFAKDLTSGLRCKYAKTYSEEE